MEVYVRERRLRRRRRNILQMRGRSSRICYISEWSGGGGGGREKKHKKRKKKIDKCTVSRGNGARRFSLGGPDDKRPPVSSTHSLAAFITYAVTLILIFLSLYLSTRIQASQGQPCVYVVPFTSHTHNDPPTYAHIWIKAAKCICCEKQPLSSLFMLHVLIFLHSYNKYETN